MSKRGRHSAFRGPFCSPEPARCSARAFTVLVLLQWPRRKIWLYCFSAPALHTRCMQTRRRAKVRAGPGIRWDFAAGCAEPGRRWHETGLLCVFRVFDPVASIRGGFDGPRKRRRRLWRQRFAETPRRQSSMRAGKPRVLTWHLGHETDKRRSPVASCPTSLHKVSPVPSPQRPTALCIVGPSGAGKSMVLPKATGPEGSG